MAILEPRPSQWTEPKTGELTLAAARYFDLALLPRVQQTSQIVPASVMAKTGQSASIGTTNLVAVASGLYRVSIYGQVVQAATTSSSLNVTIQSTYKGQSISQSLTAVTGNTLQTVLMGTIIVSADPGTLIAFTAAYASTGATPMMFDLYLTAEAL